MESRRSVSHLLSPIEHTNIIHYQIALTILFSDTAQWVAQLRDVYEPYEGGSPQFRLGLWRQVFDAPSYSRFFQPPEETVVPHLITATAESVVERVCTKSYIAIQSDEERAKILNSVSSIVEKGDGKVWVDKEKGIFEYPYTTTVVVLRRK